MCFASSIVEAHKKLFLAPNIHSKSSNSSSANITAIEGSEGPRISGVGAAAAVAAGAAASTKTIVSTSGANNRMSQRSKARLQNEVCGDCGASDPAWATINRGILLCSDCCSVHRSLGRHISIVKSLRQGIWEPSVLNFVNSLNAHGANSVWEHHLLDGANASGGGKNSIRMRKPTPKDPLHPAKIEFIKAKHVNLTFVLKPSLQDDDCVAGGNLEQELSKQLHASVRTSNLETSLRLLVQGADPNFFHEEKRSTPLHMAAKFGQASQIELLLIYGADINAIDGNGLTPLEVAKANNHKIIAERLLDAMYEVTDRFIMFLGGKKPDHSTGRHLLMPDTSSNDISEQLKIARGRLQLVPNKMFEELVMDLFDEVDRRENEAIWATSAMNADNAAVPFLPANPFLSATRNQGRQKLARFSRAEFNGLLSDVLIDALRRQNMANLRPLDATQTATGSASPSTVLASIGQCHSQASISAIMLTSLEHDPNLSDDEPIYDPVASDDDYAPAPPIMQQAIVHHSATNQAKVRQPGQQFEMENLRKQLSKYESEINQLKTVVQKLSSENIELKSKFSSVISSASSLLPPVNNGNNNCSQSNPSVYDEPLRIDLNGETENEPHSLPEGVLGSNNMNAAPITTSATTMTTGLNSSSSSSSSSANNSNQSTIKRPASMYERRQAAAFNKAGPESRTTTSMYQMPGMPNANASHNTNNTNNTNNNPNAGIPTCHENNKAFNEEVQHRTDVVTRRLKELIGAMHDAGKKDELIPCAEQTRVAVMELIAIFTQPSNCSEIIRETLKQLTRYNILIQHECENLQKAYTADDKSLIDRYIKEVRDCVYYIASAIKTLVTHYDTK